MRESRSRKMLAVVLGIIVGNGVFFLVGIVADRIYPTPPGLLDPQTPETTALRSGYGRGNRIVVGTSWQRFRRIFRWHHWCCSCKRKNHLCRQCNRRDTFSLGPLLPLCILSGKTLVSYRDANLFPSFLLSRRSCGNAIEKRTTRK